MTTSCETSGSDVLHQAADLSERLDAATTAGDWAQAQELDLTLRTVVDTLRRALEQGTLQREAAALAVKRLHAVHQRAVAALLEARDAVAAEMGNTAHARRGVHSYLECSAASG